MNLLAQLANDFILDGNDQIVKVEEIMLRLEEATADDRAEMLVRAKRALHTLKGNAGMMGFSALQEFAHELEDKVEDLDPEHLDVSELLAGVDRLRRLMVKLGNADRDVGTPGGGAHHPGVTDDHRMESVRVAFADLDALVDVLAEMVLFRNRLADAVLKGRGAGGGDDAWDEIEASEQSLGATLNVIQDRVMSLRMVPLSTLFVALKRVVHDVAISEAKEIELTVEGGDTPMDKALLEVANEALGHLIRNAAIHGIENPDDRLASGKPRRGLIRLEAKAESNEVQIDVSDDGRGIDAQELIVSATEKGIDTAEVSDPLSLLFHAGFSTKSEADIASGRGIGLTAALDSVRRLGGRIVVSSEIGVGTQFRLHLPLSVSIARALMVSADGELYALPITHVEESLRFQSDDATEVNHALVYRIRDSVIPLLDLGLVFGTARKPRASGFVVVFEAAGQRRGLLIDGMQGIREIVVKGLDSMVGSPIGVSGSTILGDGRVVLILDPQGLIDASPSLRNGANYD